MGTVSLLILVSEAEGLRDVSEAVLSIAGGTSSGAGIGRPLAAATSCASVQDSEWSFRPFQNGANRRSILNTISFRQTSSGFRRQLTCNCLTTALLKSSTPVYVPSVTRNPPSTFSSRILRSRSFNRACLSFSAFLASLSCFVSRGRSGCEVGCARSRTRLRNGKSCLLPRGVREL